MDVSESESESESELELELDSVPVVEVCESESGLELESEPELEPPVEVAGSLLDVSSLSPCEVLVAEVLSVPLAVVLAVGSPSAQARGVSRRRARAMRSWVVEGADEGLGIGAHDIASAP